MSEDMVTTSISLPPEMLALLQKRAQVEDRSVSSLLRLLIWPALDAWQREQARKAAAQKTVLRPRTSVAGAARVFEE